MEFARRANRHLPTTMGTVSIWALTDEIAAPAARAVPRIILPVTAVYVEPVSRR